MRLVELVLDLEAALEVGRPLLVLPAGVNVDGIPDHMHMWMLAVPVDEAGVVVAGCHLLRQLTADFKQMVVGDLSGLAVARVDVEAGVVILAAALVGVRLPRQIPRRRQIVGALKAEVVRPGRMALLLADGLAVDEVVHHGGRRAAG